MKKVAGLLLLIAVFGGLMSAMAARSGWMVALASFGVAVVIVALIYLALWLIIE